MGHSPCLLLGWAPPVDHGPANAVCLSVSTVCPQNSANTEKLLIMSADICTGCSVTLKSIHDAQAL